ncbi:glycosyltransferase protein LARGE2-like, partial [Tropilaelaps mercedesae]
NIHLKRGKNLLRADRWWLDQSPVDWSIQCHYPASPQPDSSTSFCARTLQINCRPSSVRAIYQNVVFTSPAEQITLSVRASGEQLEPAAAASFMGLLAFVELTGRPSQVVIEVEVDLSRLSARSNDEPLLLSNVYRVPADAGRIRSVTVMAGCQGYVGTILLSEMSLEAETKGLPVEGGPCQKNHEESHESRHDRDSKVSTKPVYLLGEPHSEELGGLRDDVSLVTQVSMDRLGVLEHTLDQWDTPVSLVIYAPFKDGRLLDDDWQRLYISKKVAAFKLHPSSVVSLVYSSDKAEQYPINALRNIAIRQAHSRFLLLADADFQPSPDLTARVLPLARDRSALSPRTSIIVPAFEYADVPHKSDVVAANKQELMQLIHAQGIVSPFRRKESPQSHASTDYWRWYTASEAYEVRPSSDKFEPYLVVEKNAHLPLYWEKFSGYGMNKISHMAELRVAGYKFWVAPDVWLIHVPHRLSTHFADHLQNATYRLANRALRFEFLHHIRRKYRLDCNDERAL